MQVRQPMPAAGRGAGNSCPNGRRLAPAGRWKSRSCSMITCAAAPKWRRCATPAASAISPHCAGAPNPAKKWKRPMSDQGARDAALLTDRHLLLQAPAGSGKTTVLAQRFLAALAQVEEPEQVLAITFTRKAAAEMRERVLAALEGRMSGDTPDLQRWAQLREGVMRQVQRRGWELEELPTRLRIQTIDSLCHEIARAMPLLGRMHQQLDVVDDAEAAFLAAAGQCLTLADEEPEHQADADRLLRRLDNDWDRAQRLL